MKKILYVNQQELTNPAIIDMLLSYNYNWKAFINLHKFNTGVDSHYVRAGKNVLPFVNGLEDYSYMPMYQPNITTTFEEATDIRCAQIKSLISTSPVLILWSGGIDSTLIITSILKHFSPSERTNIHIACNRVSIYEYPEFYFKHILPNFKVLDSTWIVVDSKLLSKYYIIDGEPADQLFCAGAAQTIPFTDPTILATPVNQSQKLKEVLKSLMPNEPQWEKDLTVNWFYQIMMDNIQSVDVPIETFYDFFWWYSFNMVWTSIKIRTLASQCEFNPDAVQLYMNKFIHWFDTEEYQQWSINTRIDGKFNQTLSGNKVIAKKYIYDYTQDNYYYRCKFKHLSTGHVKEKFVAPWFCILDDYTRLTISDNLDEILNLLPAHIKI